MSLPNSSYVSSTDILAVNDVFHEMMAKYRLRKVALIKETFGGADL